MIERGGRRTRWMQEWDEGERKGLAGWMREWDK